VQVSYVNFRHLQKTTIAQLIGMANFSFWQSAGAAAVQMSRWFPQDCLLCGAEARGALCRDCADDLPYRGTLGCITCGEAGVENQACGQCLARQPYFDATLVAFDYDFPFNRLIQAYKYGARLSLTDFFAERMAARASAVAEPLPDIIVPMPLAKKRLAERGFNQSALLGRAVAQKLGVRFGAAGLLRVRETPPQTGLSREERLKNVRGAFDCASDLKGLRMALIDDVMTTGATMSDAARALKKRGAAHVEAWALARARDQHLGAA
jgi:ComF family protein